MPFLSILTTLISTITELSTQLFKYCPLVHTDVCENKTSHLFLRTQRIFYIHLTCFEPLWELPILMIGLKFVEI